MDPTRRLNYYSGLLSNSSFFSVNVDYTATSGVAVWQPAVGRRFRLKGGIISAWVQTTLAGATPGDTVAFYDNATTTPIYPIASILSATDTTGLLYRPAVLFDLREGITSGAPNRLLLIASQATIGAGHIFVRGVIWGEEV